MTILATALVVSGISLSGFGSMPDFTQWPAGPERKRQFFAFLRPVIEMENARVLADRQRLLRIAAHAGDAELGWLDRRRLARLAEAYRIDEADLSHNALIEELLRRVDTVPISLSLAQAAKESGWGSSRFAAEGFNLFGQRCFEAGCGIVPSARDAGHRHELIRFDSPANGVASYLRNLNTHPDYEAFRRLRAGLRSEGKPVPGTRLAEKLATYSERGKAYIREIKHIISVNGLSQAAADG